MNPRTVWRRTSTPTHGRATATQDYYALTTHWQVDLCLPIAFNILVTYFLVFISNCCNYGSN